MTTIIFIVILAFFIWRGYQKGFVGAISRVLSFIVAYPAAIFLTKPFANILRAYTGMDGLILYLVAGCTIFLVASLLVTLILNFLASLAPSNSITETGSKIGGVVFGAIIGGVFGLIAVYLIDLVLKPAAPVIANQQEQKSPSAPSAEEAESIKQYVVDGGEPVKESVSNSKESFIDSAAKKLVSTAASTAVGIITSDKGSSQLTKTLTKDPQAMLNHVQNMTNNDEVKKLLSDPEFQAELNHGNVESLMQNKDFQQLLKNPDMQAIISSEDSSDKSTEQVAAEKMIQAWQKVVPLKTDQRVLDIVNDQAFQAQLNSPNKLPLLMNPKMRQLSEIIFSDESEYETKKPGKTISTGQKSNVHYTLEDITQGTGEKAKEKSLSDTHKREEQPEEKVYRWTDENGKVHYSDKPIKN
ncbi:MAG TPA: CvpA family protein [Cellvibrio sp.]|nr:CvpA family protein [Cellvibrio sp.]